MNKGMVILILSIFGFFLCAVCTFLQYQERIESDKKYEKANQELLDAQNRIIELQDINLKHITGGSNLPLLDWTVDTKKMENLGNEMHPMTYDHVILFTLENQGKYHLKDVVFSIQSPTLGIKGDAIAPSDSAKGYTRNRLGSYRLVNVMSLPTGIKKDVFELKLPWSVGTEVAWANIILEWSNGLYKIRLDIREQKDGELRITKAYSNADDTPLTEEEINAKIND